MEHCIPLSDARLISAYEKAIQLNLPNEFIMILKAEVEKRQLISIKPNNK
ncbi:MULTISPECIES: sporulation histidine kinase inhibitor Sda [Heyndrickxia]|nr:sporulation histidine kinase inhibitor Sda [Heyndrickxia shackletonii]NEZ02447.1 sporulation histidine kinase inhibitor Sda [Heyndrickxia shackletonii]